MSDQPMHTRIDQSAEVAIWLLEISGSAGRRCLGLQILAGVRVTRRCAASSIAHPGRTTRISIVKRLLGLTYFYNGAEDVIEMQL